MKQITTDNFSFESLRGSDALYVDKTWYVWKMVNEATRIYFLSRPRRFGKSLLISTLKAYFQGRKELFKGLVIERLAGDAWEEWPVIHLDMAQATSKAGLDEMKAVLVSYVSDVAADAGLPVDGDELPQDIFRRLIKHLYDRTGRPVVILIDEYDKPILDALQERYREKVVDLMQDFYQVVKSNVAMERFVFITGVSEFSHTSLFSGMNNPTDITLDPAFATMLGYTEDEFRENFAGYIDLACEKLDMEREAFIAKMKDWYDGFRFTPDAAHVFNPVSVGKFFRYYRFDNYWYETGTPAFLVKQLKNNPFRLDEYTHDWISPMEIKKFDAGDLDPMALAIQTGYLTIADVMNDEFGEFFRYDFPNEEIRMSWYDDMLRLASDHYMKLGGRRRVLYNAVKTGDVDTMMQCLQYLFAGVTKENVGEIHEGYYRNMLYMFFTALGIDCHAEEQVAGGRIDIVLQALNVAYILELKVSNTGSDNDISRLLKAGMDQAVMKGYAEKYKFEADKVHVVSVVFEGRHHQLVAWKDE